MKRARIFRALLLIAVAAVACVTRAQSPSATLSGTVLDEAGAVLPGVRIAVLNLSTALQRHATTDGEGRYIIPILPPGRYNLTAQRDGFATIQVPNVVLNVGDQLALRIRLKVGEIGETVTVVDYLDGVGSVREGPSVSTVVNRQFVENLPLNGRSFQTLFELAPGTVLTRASFNEQGQFSAAGQRPNANYFMVDGVSANVGVSAGAAPGQAAAGSLPTLTALGGTNNLVSVDALEEFRIQTSSYAPEFGRTPGAQVSIVTRSGSNEFHGSIFNYFRDDALDANDWFVNARRLPAPALRQNDFGGVLGGPVVKDRSFFFFSYEGLRLSQPQVAVTEVPSAAARAQAPAALRPFLEAYPVPNGRLTDDGLAEFAASYSDPSRVDAASLRVDATMSDRLTLFGRYNHSPSTTRQRGSTVRPGFSVQSIVNPTVAQSLNTVTSAELLTQTLTVGASYSATPQVLNELRANFSRARARTSFALDDFGGARPLAVSGLFPASVAAADASFQFLLVNGTNAGLGLGKNVDNEQGQLNVVDNLSVVRGAHQLKFGADYRRLTPVYDPVRYNLSAVFGDVSAFASAPPQTSLPPAPLSVSVFAGAGPRRPVFTNFSAYAQDTWRATRRLSVTYGVRWELNPPPHAGDGNHPLVASVNFERPDLTALAPRGTPLWQTTYDNFAPRFGLAYQLSSEPGVELVVRAGGGVFYDLGTGQSAQGFGSVAPFVAVKRLVGVPFPLTPEQAEPPPLTTSPPFGTVVAFEPSLKLPRVYQWNVALEKSLGDGQTISAAYVGARGERLLRETPLLNPNQNFEVILFTSNEARSSYHAMQLQAGRRFSRGLQALASYTWSHSIDNSSSDALSRARPIDPAAVFGFPVVDRGPSDFDARHSATAAVTYNLPAPRGESFLKSVARGWSLDAVWRARTATPVNIVTRTDVIGSGTVVELQRPDYVAGVPVYIDDPTAPGGRRINRAAFAVPAFVRQGSLGYNALRGFGVSQLDAALRREVRLGEGARLQLRAEAFNLFNHPSFGNPVSDLSSPDFGRSTQTFARGLGAGGINGGLSPLYQIGGPRSVQLAIKLLF